MQQAQAAAARAVRGVLGGETLAAAFTSSRLDDARTRALATELAHGTLRFHGELDLVLRSLTASNSPERAIAALACVALYQLVHTTAPQASVVDSAVETASLLRRRSARAYVNAVLRNFLRRKDELLSTAHAADVGRYSYPAWWIERVRREYPQKTAQILDAGNTRPTIVLRTNARRIGSEDYVARLASAGIGASSDGGQAVELDRSQDVRALPGYAEGLFSVQDAGAQLAAPVLAAASGMRVLDACAAPGGKATHIAELADVELTALDVDAARLAIVSQNFARLGLSAKLACNDASRPDMWWDGVPYDRILVDAPCTGSGIVRRHPDIKWLRREADVAALAQRQQALLDALWPCLARNGRLLYVTCSIFDAENEARIEAFVAAHQDACRIRIDIADRFEHVGAQLLPAAGGPAHNHDGFFYALLEKSELR